MPVVNPVAMLRTLTQPLPAGEERIAPGTDFGANAGRLIGREDDKAQALLNQRIHHLVVASGFGQPHRFGLSAKAITKIREAPANLSVQIPLVTKRQNRVAVCLSDCVPVAVVL